MVVVYTCTVEHECTVGQTCTVKQPLLNYVQWNNGAEFPITSKYKFRSGAKGSALVILKNIYFSVMMQFPIFYGPEPLSTSGPRFHTLQDRS